MPLLPKCGRNRPKVRVQLLGIYLFILLMLFFVNFQPFWVLTSTFKQPKDIYKMPPNLWPNPFSTQAWRDIFSPGFVKQVTGIGLPVTRYLFNSVVITFGAMAVSIFFSAFASYAVAKLFSPKWKQRVFFFFIAAMFVPSEVLLIPTYLILNRFPIPDIPFTNIRFPGVNLLDTYWAVILPAMIAPYYILLFRGYFETIDSTLLDAARIDGCSEWGIFFRVVLPTSVPVFAVVALFSFQAHWNEFFWPLIVLKRYDLAPLPLLIQRLLLSVASGPETAGRVAASWSHILVIGVLSGIPNAIAFLLAQKYVTKGIQFGAFR